MGQKNGEVGLLVEYLFCGRTECLHDKNSPAFAGIMLCLDRTKNATGKIFHAYKRNMINMRDIIRTSIGGKLFAYKAL